MVHDSCAHTATTYQDTHRAAKKPARNTREYIDRKKENTIFAPL